MLWSCEYHVSVSEKYQALLNGTGLREIMQGHRVIYRDYVYSQHVTSIFSLICLPITLQIYICSQHVAPRFPFICTHKLYFYKPGLVDIIQSLRTFLGKSTSSVTSSITTIVFKFTNVFYVHNISFSYFIVVTYGKLERSNQQISLHMGNCVEKYYVKFSHYISL